MPPYPHNRASVAVSNFAGEGIEERREEVGINDVGLVSLQAMPTREIGSSESPSF